MNNPLITSMPFAAHLGIELIKAETDGVEAELTVREEHCTVANSVHGGTLMALADSVGAITAFLNLPEGASGTTTIESKTNFLRSAPVGAKLQARSVPVNVGRKLCVVSTTICAETDKPVAIVTQTQLVL